MDKNNFLAKSAKAYAQVRDRVVDGVNKWARENPETMERIQIAALVAIPVGIAAWMYGNHATFHTMMEMGSSGAAWIKSLPPGVADVGTKLISNPYVPSGFTAKTTQDINLLPALANFFSLPVYAKAEVIGDILPLAGLATFFAAAAIDANAERTKPYAFEKIEQEAKRAAEIGSAQGNSDTLSAELHKTPGSIDVKRLNAHVDAALNELRDRGTPPEARTGAEHNKSLSLG